MREVVGMCGGFVAVGGNASSLAVVAAEQSLSLLTKSKNISSIMYTAIFRFSVILGSITRLYMVRFWQARLLCEEQSVRQRLDQ